MEALSKFRSLEELNLSKNPFSWLPPNLSILHSVTSLNVMDVPFANFSATVEALTTMQNLRSLYIGMTEEE